MSKQQESKPVRSTKSPAQPKVGTPDINVDQTTKKVASKAKVATKSVRSAVVSSTATATTKRRQASVNVRQVATKKASTSAKPSAKSAAVPSSRPSAASSNDSRLNWLELQKEFVDQYQKLFTLAAEHKLPPLSDTRFRSTAWDDYPQLSFLAHLYLLSSNTMKSMLETYNVPQQTKERLRFLLSQWIDAFAPSNFFALNADALKAFEESGGKSLQKGLMNFWHDFQKGRISQTDESAFEIGRNLAITEGSVVFQNNFFQLIQYAPKQASVYKTPLLMVPPCINKYYILDLQPANSLVNYMVEQGYSVFIISWRNPLPSDTDNIQQATWDDFVKDVVIEAINVVRDITNESQINAMGFCVGGTLLATAAAILKARQQEVIKSISLMTSFLDFSDTGIINVFVDEEAALMREQSIGHGGLMTAKELNTTFSFLRPNELVWNYVVNNYYKGESPSAFDILYWNADSTNLAGPFFAWYFRNTYLENNLIQPDKVSVDGTPVNIHLLELPAFVYASKDDHIVPWKTAYASAQALNGPVDFVLGASGHIAGVINPPAKKKRNFWLNPEPFNHELSADAWFEKAQEHPGSWWGTWSQWLQSHSGDKVSAPQKLGSTRYPELEPAPGSYVKVKAI